jgi:S1 RNA binding domain protein
MPYGAFVKLSDGRSGMVHISELSHNYVKEVQDFLKIGDAVNVIELEKKDGKLNLSIKRAQAGNQAANCAPQNTTTKRRDRVTDHPSGLEDMISRFKQSSNEKLAAIKKNTGNKRGGNRKGSGKK